MCTHFVPLEFTQCNCDTVVYTTLLPCIHTVLDDRMIRRGAQCCSSMVLLLEVLSRTAYITTYTMYPYHDSRYFHHNIPTVYLTLNTHTLPIVIADCQSHKWLYPHCKITLLYLKSAQLWLWTKYPQRRSAFTYLDEEQPSWLDFGKDRFEPLREEEVEDVNIVLYILPHAVDNNNNNNIYRQNARASCQCGARSASPQLFQVQNTTGCMLLHEGHNWTIEAQYINHIKHHAAIMSHTSLYIYENALYRNNNVYRLHKIYMYATSYCRQERVNTANNKPCMLKQVQ